MKTILFFDRCELTDLYISISTHLTKSVNVIHVAFSSEEANKLKASGIMDYIDYQSLLKQHIDTSPVNDSIIQEIDSLIINITHGRFNLNSSIQSDRGFSILTYEEALLLAQSHYLTWKDIFSKQKVDIMYHEICSQYMVHIAALLCKHQGGIYRDFIQCSSDKDGYSYLNVDGEDFNCDEIETKYQFYRENPNLINKERCEAFLDAFRKDYSVFFGAEINFTIPYITIVLQALKSWVIKFINRNRFDKIKENINCWMLCSNPNADKLRNIREYKKRRINFVTDVPENETYYYYSFHLEPEATVLYLGDGIYENQVKLIQNIAASLPAGAYLYVKDHPHEYAYRDACDYERLMKIPNVRLIHQSIPGKRLIAKAKGVFSINGTACFEALLLGKQVFCLGHSYYSCQERVNVIKNIRDIRGVIYSLKDKIYDDDINLFAFIFAYLESSHSGFTSFFGNRHISLGIDIRQNGLGIAENITKELYTNN